MIRIALAGNPNSGKTTLFNALTGSNQYVGNWPGVTVEKKEGRLKGQPEVVIQDLPGVYSLSPYTPEEIITRSYLVKDRPNVIIDIVDASNLERNLYLTSQLLELNIPVVIALNMMDVVDRRGDVIDTEALSRKLGLPVIEMSASRRDNVMEAAKAAIALAVQEKKPDVQIFSPAVQKAIEASQQVLDVENAPAWYALKVLENDQEVIQELNLTQEKLQKVAAIRQKLEKETGDDIDTLIANERYEWIGRMLEGAVKKHTESAHAMTVSDKIDRVVTNRWLALPIFFLVMGLVYYLALSTVGTWMTDWVNDVFVAQWCQGGMTAFLESVHASDWVISLVVDGIIGGIGAPLGFVPQMAIVFLCLSFLEDCGYMSRIAFIMDRIFRRFGLSGKSFISFMISTGCGIPGILAARTIEDEKDRRMTMIVTTSMPCGAKLPVIAMIAGSIMNNTDSWWIAWATYLFGLAAIVMGALVLKHTKMFQGVPAPFIMELPQYHWPRFSSVLRQTWDRCWHFIKKAGTLLFACCVVVWFLSSYGFGPDGFGLVDVEYSLLAAIGGFFSPLFMPLGWGNWQAVASSLSGFVAKEQITSTMGVLVNVADETGESPALWMAVQTMFPSGLAAFSFLLFNLLDSPCLAAVSTLAREMNSRRWTAFAIGWQMFYGYTMALIVYQIGSLIAYGTFTVWTLAALVLAAWYIYMMFGRSYRDSRRKKESAA